MVYLIQTLDVTNEKPLIGDEIMVASPRINALDSFGVKSPSRTDPIAAMEAAGALFGLRKDIGMTHFEREQLAAILQHEAHPVRHQSGTEAPVVALNE